MLTWATFLSIAGRSSDMYIRGGFNVHPLEVEQVIATDTAIRQAAVVGRSVPVIGEIGVAVVVAADPDHPPVPEELRTHVSRELADYRAPDELVVVDELPMTAMLKPDRAALRKLIVERAGRP